MPKFLSHIWGYEPSLTKYRTLNPCIWECRLSSLLICQSFLPTFKNTNRASPNTETHILHLRIPPIESPDITKPTLLRLRNAVHQALSNSEVYCSLLRLPTIEPPHMPKLFTVKNAAVKCVFIFFSLERRNSSLCTSRSDGCLIGSRSSFPQIHDAACRYL